jgi:hypothetical protein
MRKAACRNSLLQAALPAAVLAAAALLPAPRPLPFDACLLHRLTGLPCLTCGLTRSVCFFVQGEWAASLALHPAGGPAVILLALHALWRTCEAARGRLLARPALARITSALGAAAAIVSVGAWLVRLAPP